METTNNAQGENVIVDTQNAGCPTCGKEDTGHSCRVCKMEMPEEECGNRGGCCGETCQTSAQRETVAS